jgi:myo-inositol-1(or 4)-monophosphatase
MPITSLDAPIDLNFLRSCLVDAGQMALTQRGQMVAEVKADLSPVTAVDRQVETFLIERIAAHYPSHQVLSEESGLHPHDKEFTWVIDPIDGTRSFASGLPIWGISIGVFYQDEPHAGGLYLPVTREMYWGTRSQAFYNEQPIPPVRSVDLDSPLVFLAVPSNFHLHFDITYPRQRSMGSTAAHLAYTATRAAVGTLMGTVSLWDVAGLLPVLAAVGIEFGALSGRAFHPVEMMDGKTAREPLIAAHPSVINILRESIHEKRDSGQ